MDEIPGAWTVILIFLGGIVVVTLVVSAVVTGLVNLILAKTRSASSAPKRIRFADVLLPACVLVVLLFMFMRWQSEQQEELLHQETIRQVRGGEIERGESNIILEGIPKGASASRKPSG